MEQTREGIMAPEAKAFMARAAGLTQAAIRSDMGRAVAQAAVKGPDHLLQQLGKAAEASAPDPMTSLKVMVSEQGQHFEQLRAAIGQIGQSLNELNQRPTVEGNLALLNAQSEAIQGLTLLAIKGQQMQAETVKALEFAAQNRPQQNPMQKWIYYMMGFMMFWSMLGMIF